MVDAIKASGRNCCLECGSSAMERWVVGWVAPDVLKQRTAFIFQGLLGYFGPWGPSICVFFRNLANHSPSNTLLHPRRLAVLPIHLWESQINPIICVRFRKTAVSKQFRGLQKIVTEGRMVWDITPRRLANSYQQIEGFYLLLQDLAVQEDGHP
jgi:hypothetical protein